MVTVTPESQVAIETMVPRKTLLNDQQQTSVTMNLDPRNAVALAYLALRYATPEFWSGTLKQGWEQLQDIRIPGTEVDNDAPGSAGELISEVLLAQQMETLLLSMPTMSMNNGVIPSQETTPAVDWSFLDQVEYIVNHPQRLSFIRHDQSDQPPQVILTHEGIPPKEVRKWLNNKALLFTGTSILMYVDGTGAHRQMTDPTKFSFDQVSKGGVFGNSIEVSQEGLQFFIKVNISLTPPENIEVIPFHSVREENEISIALDRDDIKILSRSDVY